MVNWDEAAALLADHRAALATIERLRKALAPILAAVPSLPKWEQSWPDTHERTVYLLLGDIRRARAAPEPST